MEIINGYRIIGELKSNNSGYSKWGFAEKDGVEVFIKEFLSPIYPLDARVLSKEQILRKRHICEVFEQEKRSFYDELNKCATGNVVTVVDFFRSGSKYYMVTDKVNAAAISPSEISRMTVEQIVLIIKIIVHSIEALHSHGIVHGDIKPDNILFKQTRKGVFTAKIIDFDSSFQETKPPSGEEEFQGDMVYLAPESFMFIAEEGGILTRKIDIFALGILFHQYFSGELPSYDNTQYDYVFEAILDGQDIGISPRVPVEFREIIKSMLDKEPDNRPDINAVFNAFMGGTAAVSHHTAPAERKDAGSQKGFLRRARGLI